MRYPTALLAAVPEIMGNRQTVNHSYSSNNGSGKYGIREGQLSHVADNMKILNKAWSETPRSTIKCWMKSECLGGPQMQNLSSIRTGLIQDLDVDVYLAVNNEISRMEIDSAVDMQNIQSIQ